MKTALIIIICLKIYSLQLFAQNVSNLEIKNFENKVNLACATFPISLDKNDSVIVDYLLKKDIDKLRYIVSTYILNWCVSINKQCELQKNIRFSKHLFCDSTIIYKLYLVDISVYEDIFDTGDYMDIIEIYYQDNSEFNIKKLLNKNKKLITICIKKNR